MFEIGQQVLLTEDACEQRDMVYGYPVFIIDDITFDEIDDERVFVLDGEDGRCLMAYASEIEAF